MDCGNGRGIPPWNIDEHTCWYRRVFRRQHARRAIADSDIRFLEAAYRCHCWSHRHIIHLAACASVGIAKPDQRALQHDSDSLRPWNIEASNIPSFKGSSAAHGDGPFGWAITYLHPVRPSAKRMRWLKPPV